jgi:uncharacterized membrane protein YjjP (DUF1212 family)
VVIEQSKTRAQMWTAIVMLLLSSVGLAACMAGGGDLIALIALIANQVTWWMVILACREDLKPKKLTLPGDRVVREPNPLRRRA